MPFIVAFPFEHGFWYFIHTRLHLRYGAKQDGSTPLLAVSTFGAWKISIQKHYLLQTWFKQKWKENVKIKRELLTIAMFDKYITSGRVKRQILLFYVSTTMDSIPEFDWWKSWFTKEIMSKFVGTESTYNYTIYKQDKLNQEETSLFEYMIRDYS